MLGFCMYVWMVATLTCSSGCSQIVCVCVCTVCARVQYLCICVFCVCVPPWNALESGVCPPEQIKAPCLGHTDRSILSWALHGHTGLDSHIWSCKKQEWGGEEGGATLPPPPPQTTTIHHARTHTLLRAGMYGRKPQKQGNLEFFAGVRLVH